MERYALDADDFGGWRSYDREVFMEVVQSEDLTPPRPVMRAIFDVDHKSDGGSGSPKGWPRLRFDFPEPFPLYDWDFFTFRVKISSDRSEKDATRTLLGFNYQYAPGDHATYRMNLGGKQEEWVTIRIPVADILKPKGHQNRKDPVSLIQLVIAESDYKDETHLEFDFADMAFIRKPR